MNKKILLVPTLIAGITISFATFKFSFAAQQGEINASSVNFRESASQTSNIIQSLSKGAKVTIDGEEGNFYKITYNSKTGYVSKQFVKVSSDSSNETANSSANTTNSNTNTNTNQNASSATASSIVQASTNAGNQTEQLTEEEAIKKNEVSLKNEETMYSLPLLNSTEIGTVAKDEKVTLVSINGKWAYVRGSKNSGWVNKESLSSETIYLPSGAESSSSENESSENTESGASTVEETENENTSTTSTASDAKSTTSSSNVDNSSSKTRYVNANSVNIRDKASTSSEIIGSLEKNTSITVIGTEGEWSRIQTSGGSKGYILTKYLSTSKQ